MNHALTLLACVLVLVGCGGQFDHVGRPPALSAIGEANAGAAPLVTPQRASIASPPPEPPRFGYQQGSLWAAGPQALVGDRRARGRGDILTIVIAMDDSAEMRNATDRSRQGSQNLSIGALFGVQNSLQRRLGGDDALENAVDIGSRSQARGQGSVRRNERMTLRLAATVVDVLPNGHFVVQGDQEVRVNHELRDLQISGIVRPEDISRQNEVSYDRIANARISYGGRGHISDVQQPRIGQQIADILLPF